MKIAALALLAAPALSLAWNAEGHRQIADIAWLKLTPKAKASIGRILMGADERFRPKDASEKAVRAAFRDLSTMPDVIKGARDTAYEPLVAPSNATWIDDKSDYGREGDRCKTWHYYDVPIRYTGAKPKVQESNANNALLLSQEGLRRTMGKNDLQASWWLGWIEHVTGDLHQPLHCVSNYEHDHEDGDAGGNGVKLGINSERYNRPMALHAYWDEAIDHAKAAESTGRGSTSIERVSPRWIAEKGIQPASAQVRDLDPMDWIKEGAKLADKFVYTGEIKDGAIPSAGYNFTQNKLARRQAVLGGYRLAAMLNKILG